MPPSSACPVTDGSPTPSLSPRSFISWHANKALGQKFLLKCKNTHLCSLSLLGIRNENITGRGARKGFFRLFVLLIANGNSLVFVHSMFPLKSTGGPLSSSLVLPCFLEQEDTMPALFSLCPTPGVRRVELPASSCRCPGHCGHKGNDPLNERALSVK